MSANGLQERFASLGDKDLRKIVEETSGDYTPEALKLAKKELASRGVTVSESRRPDPDGARVGAGRTSPPPLVAVLIQYVAYVVCTVGPVATFVAGPKARFPIRLGFAMIVLIAGLFLLGMAEIIKQLHRIAESA